MNLIKGILETYYDLTHMADKNYQQIIASRVNPMFETYRQRTDILAGDSMLVVQYNIIKNATHNWQHFLKARRLLSCHLFASAKKATTAMTGRVAPKSRKLNLISDCYNDAFVAYAELAATYQSLLETVEKQNGFSPSNITDLLQHYIAKLETADFSEDIIFSACSHAVANQGVSIALEVKTLLPLIEMDKDFRKLLRTSAALSPQDKSACLSHFLRMHFPGTNLPMQFSQQYRRFRAPSVASQSTSLWSATIPPVSPPLSAPPALQSFSSMKRSV